MANLLAAGLASNATLMVRTWATESVNLAIPDMARSLRAAGEAINQGDLQAAERVLCAQALALNAIFTVLGTRATEYMGENLQKAELLMRLAFKAQNQCRNTLDTLFALKNPPVVIAKQANIANGGPQQVLYGMDEEPARTNKGGKALTRNIQRSAVQTNCAKKHGCEKMDN